MKHITYGDKTTFLTDETADTLLEYAAVLADHRRADSFRRSVRTETRSRQRSF